MYKKTPNAIQRARISSGLTQEALAECAGYSDDTIRAWENGLRNCPLDALGILSEVLCAPWLTGVYLRETSGNGALDELIPEFQVGRPLPEAAAEYISCILELVDDKFDRKLLRMVADGKIDDTEQPIYQIIMDTAAKSIKAYYEMRFANKKEG